MPRHDHQRQPKRQQQDLRCRHRDGLQVIDPEHKGAAGLGLGVDFKEPKDQHQKQPGPGVQEGLHE